MDFETMGEEVLGEDSLMGEEMAVVGAPRLRSARSIRFPPRPNWRNQLAPGVGMPGQGLQPLPLVNPAGAATFTSTVVAFNLEARPQRPFRGERLTFIVRRNGATAAAPRVAATGIFIGVQPQMVELNNFDVEFFGPTSFGMRLNLVAAEPGLLIRIPLLLENGLLVAPDTIAVSAVILGRAMR